MRVPPLETERLIVRELVMDDLAAAHRILDEDIGPVPDSEAARPMEVRRTWLEWTIAGYEQLALLYQPPYGDRAMALKETGGVVGICGIVPSLVPLGLLPSFGGGRGERADALVPEVGLFYWVSKDARGRGYATEAASALIDYGFQTLNLRRIVATTTHDNAASMSVMRRLGMTVERNTRDTPPWFQVLGILEPPN